MIDAISKGAAHSWQMENRGKTILASEFDFDIAVDLMRKDLGICLEEAQRNGSALPVTRQVDQYYAEIQKRDGGKLDTSSPMILLDRH